MNEKVTTLRGADATLTDEQKEMLAACQRVRESILSGQTASMFVLLFDHNDDPLEPEIEGDISILALHYHLHAQVIALASQDDD